MSKKTTKETQVNAKDPLEGFVDISNREKMVYVFPNGMRLEIFDPKLLKVVSKGIHKVIDRDNIGFYINLEDGYYLYWILRDGTNPYTF